MKLTFKKYAFIDLTKDDDEGIREGSQNQWQREPFEADSNYCNLRI